MAYRKPNQLPIGVGNQYHWRKVETDYLAHVVGGDIKRNIPPVNQKMLTQQLRELEADGIINRKVFAEVPPRAEYSLTERGLILTPVLQDLYA